MPPTISRLRFSSVAMRSVSGMSSALEWVRNGRAGRAARDRQQRRRLDLEEAARVDEAPHLRDDARARDHHVAHVRVDDQVDVAAAVALLGVLQPVPLVGQRLQRLAEHLERAHVQRQIARLRAEHEAVRAHDVAALDLLRDGERSSPTSSLRTNSWNRPVRSCRSKKMILPCPRTAMMRPASGPALAFRTALLAELGVLRRELRGVRGDVVPRRGERVDAALAQRGEPRAARGDQIVRHRHGTPAPSAGVGRFLGLLRVLVDRLDLVLHLPARRGDVDRLAFLAAHQRAPERRLVGEPRVLRIGFGRADDRELVRRARAGLFDLDRRAEVHFVGDVVATRR